MHYLHVGTVWSLMCIYIYMADAVIAAVDMVLPQKAARGKHEVLKECLLLCPKFCKQRAVVIRLDVQRTCANSNHG